MRAAAADLAGQNARVLVGTGMAATIALKEANPVTPIVFANVSDSNRQEECVQMPVKIARSAPRPSFGLPELLVSIHSSRKSCCKVGKARIFTPVPESSGESRLIFLGRHWSGIEHKRDQER
jgi:hypothetical protein